MTEEERAARAASQILSGDGMPGASDDPARSMLARFYSLVVTLPDPKHEHVSSAPSPGRPAKRRRAPRTVTLPVPLFVVIVAALLFAAALLVVPRPSFEPQTALYLAGTVAAGSARGVALADSSRLVVYTSGLSGLEPGYRYVVWAVTDDGYRRVGTLTSLSNARARLSIDSGATPTRIEITIEQTTSTGPPAGPTVLAGVATP